MTLRSTAECVLQEFHDRQEDDPDMEKIPFIKTAAKLIVGFHMTSLKYKLKNYRSYRDFTFTMH